MPINMLFQYLIKWSERNITQRLSENPAFQRFVLTTNQMFKTSIDEAATKLKKQDKKGYIEGLKQFFSSKR